MQAGTRFQEDVVVAELVERVNRAGDGAAAREAYRDGFRMVGGGILTGSGTLTVSRSTARDNAGSGLTVTGTGSLAVTSSMVTGNGIGLENASVLAVVEVHAASTTVQGNGTNLTGTITPVGGI